MRVRALQDRGAGHHRQQVAAVEDAAADVPSRVEVGDQPAPLGVSHRGGGVEGGEGLGIVLRHADQGARVDSMEYTHLGRSGLSVSRLCLGTMNFGWKTEEADSHAIMDRAPAGGVNFFDTANVYGFDAGQGRTEGGPGGRFAPGGEGRRETGAAPNGHGG